MKTFDQIHHYFVFSSNKSYRFELNYSDVTKIILREKNLTNKIFYRKLLLFCNDIYAN